MAGAITVSRKRLRDKITQTKMTVEGREIDFFCNVKNLRVILESELSIESRVSSVHEKRCFELKKISITRDHLSEGATTKNQIVLAFLKFGLMQLSPFRDACRKYETTPVVKYNAALWS